MDSPSPEPVPGHPDVYAVETHLRVPLAPVTVYVVDAAQPAVVDTGAAYAVEGVLAALDELDIAPEAVGHVVPTHAHLDHAGGTGGLAVACPGATVHCHERGLPYLTDADRLARLQASVAQAIGADEPFGTPEPLPRGRARALTDGDRIDLGDRTLEAIHAPGHAPHQTSLFDPDDGVLFAGDAAGIYVGGEVVPVTPPPAFDLQAALDTAARLRALDPSVVCYGHTGPGTDPAAELRTFTDRLRTFVAAVRRVSEASPNAGPEAVVDAIREDWPLADLAREDWPPENLAMDVRGVLGYLERSGDAESR